MGQFLVQQFGMCSGGEESRLLCVFPLALGGHKQHDCLLLGLSCARDGFKCFTNIIIFMAFSQRYHPILHIKEAMTRELSNVSKVSSRTGFKHRLNDTGHFSQSLCCPCTGVSLGPTALPCETKLHESRIFFSTGLTTIFQCLPSAVPDT